MVEQSVPVDAIFNALGDPTRLALVERMTRGEHTLGELAEPFAISLQAVQKHLRVLQEAGLVATRKQGRERRCRLNRAGLHSAERWIEARRRLWERRSSR